MYPFEKLIVWQRAQSLTVSVLADFPPSTDPRMRIVADQAWRASCSIAANIVEGAASASSKQFARYLGLALASAYELESHLRVAMDANLLARDQATTRIGNVIEVKRMLWALRERVKRGGREGDHKGNGDS